MRIIRASEIGAYLYCQRSWWYRISGVEPENKRELQVGTDIHYQHGRSVAASMILRVAGAVLFLSALAFMIFTLMTR